VVFCSPFDEALALSGPAAVFQPDREGRLRFEADWTRDVWERAAGPHALAWTWTLLRDHDTGFVQLLLVTSPSLLVRHPRADVRPFPDLGAAREALADCGQPPLRPDGW
jgi:hypothetical protein